MVLPELLIVVAADEIFTSVVISHFCICASELGDKVEEVQREKYHGCDQPFQGKY